MNLVFKNALLLFIFFLISCKKDKKDTQPPIISFNIPVSGQTYKMFDTIPVNAHISDNEHISSVSITLTDINHVPQQSSINASIPSANFILTMNYILNQFHLSSGNYYLQIAADDGFNTTVAYQSIYIIESPTLLWGYCAVFKSNNKLISYYDTVRNNLFSFPALSQPFNGMKYGGYNEQLYINGNTTQDFQAYTMQNRSGSPNYIENASTSQQNYTSIYTDGYKPYVGFYNSDIYSYQNTGSTSTSYRLNDNNFYSYCFATSSNYGVAAFKSKNTSVSNKLVAFYGNSGAVFQSALLASPNCTIANVVAMFEKAQDTVYVLGNDASNNATAYLFYPPSIGFMPISGMPSGKMLSAVKVNNNSIIFSTATGVYACNGLIVNPVSLLSNGAQKLYYQPKLNMLTVATSTTICTYTVGSTALSSIPRWTLPFAADSLIDFEVITNK